jgi:hypothetical protein
MLLQPREQLCREKPVADWSWLVSQSIEGSIFALQRMGILYVVMVFPFRSSSFHRIIVSLIRATKRFFDSEI